MGGTEIRYPMPIINGLCYSFFEHNNSLTSSKELHGNPNAYYRLHGSGSSWGYGIKLGPLRFEYAQDCNLGKGSTMIIAVVASLSGVFIQFLTISDYGT